MVSSDRSRAHRCSRAFTLVELLVVITILGMLALVAVQLLTRRIGNPVLPEVVANILRISSELERDYANGTQSYSADGTSAGCPGERTYSSSGTQVGELPIAIQGDYYAYTVTTTDADGDGKCECYLVTAVGIRAPTIEEPTVIFDCRGVKTGPWP